MRRTLSIRLGFVSLRAAGFGWRGPAMAAALSIAAVSACTDKTAPEYVADQFVDAYFRRMDQQGARQYTALGATEMLDRELELTRSVRAQGYSSAEAAAQVVVRRNARSTRGDRVRFDYDISIKHDESEEHRMADVELAKIQAAWKVVRIDIRAQ
jgi:hypothetical protein